MNQDSWRKHIERRSDFSTRLTHLTRRCGAKSALSVLCEILDSKTIMGSTQNGYIIGNVPVVCFQELPLYSLAENIKFEDELFINSKDNHILAPRYEAFGLRFNKGALFQKYNARPVVYGPKEEMKSIINEDNYWRIVSLDYSNHDAIIDWTHEREWRVKGNLSFEYSEVEVIVGCAKAYQEFIGHYKEKNSILLEQIQGIIVLDSLIK